MTRLTPRQRAVRRLAYAAPTKHGVAHLAGGLDRESVCGEFLPFGTSRWETTRGGGMTTEVV